MRPKRITLNPTATDADGISADTPFADEYLTLEGALATGYDVDALVTTTDPVAGGSITMDGAAVTGGTVAVIDPARCVVVNCAGDETARTFTISGTYKGNAVTDTITGLNTNVAVGTQRFDFIHDVSVDDATAGNIQVGTNGLLEFSTPQHVTVASTGNDSGAVLTVYGTDNNGIDFSEAITEPNAGTSVGAANFATIYAVVSDTNAVGTITVGVDGTCESQWIPVSRVSENGINIAVSGQISTGATLTYGLRYTYDDVFAADFDPATAVSYAHGTVTAENANADGSITVPVTAIRWEITAYTSGSVEGTVIQADY